MPENPRTAHQHVTESERLLNVAAEAKVGTDWTLHRSVLDRAQTHATLALALAIIDAAPNPLDHL